MTWLRDRIHRQQCDYNLNRKRETNKVLPKVEEEEPNPHTINRKSKGTASSKVEEISRSHSYNAQVTSQRKLTIEFENPIRTE